VLARQDDVSNSTMRVRMDFLIGTAWIEWAPCIGGSRRLRKLGSRFHQECLRARLRYYKDFP
jgi:hypothetical protein